MVQDQPVRVMFVCTGNICRSPMAEAVFRKLVDDAGLLERFEIASTGTDDEDEGLPIHRGTRGVLQKHGIPIPEGKRATLISRADLETYNYVLAMTQRHLQALRALHPSPPGETGLLMEFAPGAGSSDIADPYYTGDFDGVYRMISAGCRGLLAHIREQEQF